MLKNSKKALWIVRETVESINLGADLNISK